MLISEYLFFLFQILAQELDQEIVSFGRPPGGGGAEQLFSPIVTATCRAGIMTIKLETVLNFIWQMKYAWN